MRISIIVPAKNAGAYIAELLDGLFAQTRNADEIIIVDAGSSDNTSAIVGNYVRKYPGKIKLIQTGSAYPGKARNIAASECSGDIILTTDADTVPDPDWVRAIVAVFEEDPSADAVLGTFRADLGSYFEKCAAYICMPIPALWDGRFVYTESFVSAGIRRAAFIKSGGFMEDVRGGEDLALLQSMRRLGFKIGQAATAEVRWRLPQSVSALLQRGFLYSRDRVYSDVYAKYIYKVTAFYAVLVLWGVLYGKYAALICALVIIARMLKIFPTLHPVLKLFMKNPLNWAVVGTLVFMNDVSYFVGCLVGLFKKVGGRSGRR